jgi:hypothetical protein
LFEQGKVVTLSIGRWRAEQRLLSEDIGLDRATFVKDFLKLGRKTLVPPLAQMKMNSVEHAARAALKKYVFEPVWALMPAQRFPDLETDMDERTGEWFEQRGRHHGYSRNYWLGLLSTCKSFWHE